MNRDMVICGTITKELTFLPLESQKASRKRTGLKKVVNKPWLKTS